jgi:hypothetical protein
MLTADLAATTDHQRDNANSHMSKEGADVQPERLQSREAEKLVVNVNYGSRFDPGVILLGFIVVCTAYVLAKLY